MEKIFIKNVVDVEVEGLKGVNRYIVKSMYDLVDEEGYADIVFETIEDMEYTWEEIERDGGIAGVNAQLKEIYGI